MQSSESPGESAEHAFGERCLVGTVSIVTGASSGFGARFVEVLAAHGSTVVAAARRLDRLEELAGSRDRIHAFQCDVQDDDQLQALVDWTAENFGSVDVVVNNAGVSDGPAKAELEDPAEFRRVMNVNLNACFVLAAAAARQMIGSGTGGSIINISSVHGLVASAPNNQAAYVASKGALVNLTRELAIQWARHNIRVNAIAPGYFATELTEGLLDESNESGRAWVLKNTPMRRTGELSELDGPLMLLASGAGSYITGQTLAVDGGWTAR